MFLNRDSIWWAVGMVGGVAVGLAGSITLFPWIPEPWQRGIAVTAFIYSTIAGKMATSPLPGNVQKTMSTASGPIENPPAA